MGIEIILISVVVLSLIFDFLNGFNDSANVVATIITSGAMKPTPALIMAACCEVTGPFLFGVAVAHTIGKGIVNPDVITITVIGAAMTAAIFWNFLTWYFGIPSSSSHGLIGGLIGAVLIGYGPSFINMHGVWKVIISLFTSPIIGLCFGFIFMKLIIFLVNGRSPKINWFFKKAQIPTSIALALSHGANDAQKTMGIITMSLVILKYQTEFIVPLWVVAACALAIGIGTALGGKRIIKTVGYGIYHVRPVHGFAAQATAASVILTAALLGGPVSTSHVMSSSVMGVGAAERVKKVRWGIVKKILTTWVVTIPSTAIVSSIFYIILHNLFGG